jgi:hypothetical protein
VSSILAIIKGRGPDRLVNALDQNTLESCAKTVFTFPKISFKSKLLLLEQIRIEVNLLPSDILARVLEMTPSELGQKCNDSLHQMKAAYISGGDIPADQLQKAFIYFHIKTIAGLMDDILFLERHSHTTVARCAVRPMMESLFNLGAAIRDESFVFNKVAWENDKWFSEEHQNESDRKKLKALATKGKQDLSNFKRKHKVGEIQNWNKIHKIAKIAKLSKVYDHYYSLACNHVHSNLVGILSYGSTSRGMTMRTATMIVSMAIQFAGSHIAPSNRKSYEKMSSDYIAELEKLSADGSYE